MSYLMLTTAELADELRCGETKAKELLKRGAVKSVKVGNSRRIRRADLEAYIEALPESLPGDDEDEAA